MTDGQDPVLLSGVMLDAKRKMLWTVDNVNWVRALKLDAKALKLHKLD